MTTSTQTLTVLCGTAITIAVGHTLLGPDHYIPFVAMARAGRWRLGKTVVITILCGVGHVLGSLVLGLVGVAVGATLFSLEWVERFRGDVAGWLLIGFGLAYSAWGVRRAVRHRPHTHWHAHANGMVHEHRHVHVESHAHVHAAAKPDDGVNATRTLTPWVLFTIFVFGPCEPLIPLLMYPASKGHVLDVLIVTLVFGVATIATMVIVVVVGYGSVGTVTFGRLERFTHALAGLAIVACGAAVQFGL